MLSGAMTLEGYSRKCCRHLEEELHLIRPFKGNYKSSRTYAYVIKRILKMRMIISLECHRVQDPYSIRCIPQVHGASRNAYVAFV